MFTLDPVLDLIDTLRAAGIRADVDAAQLQAPAVWVQPVSFALDTLASTLDTVRLVLFVDDTPPRLAYPALVALLNQVRAVVPVASAATRSVLMPSGAYLPGLETQVALRADITTE